MIFDTYVVFLLFIVGLFISELLILIGLKLPLKDKSLCNLCDYCNNKNKWYEMLPIISYFLSNGNCNYCNNKLNIWYILLELLVGLLYGVGYLIYGFSFELLVFLIIISLFAIICVSDFKYYIILDESLIFCSIFILLLKLLFFGFRTFLISLISGVILFAFVLLIKLVSDKIFGQESLGGGDVKLVAVFGFTFGVRLSIVSLIFGAILAFPFALYAAFTKTEKEIPFGPFLCLALIMVFVFMEPIKDLLSVIFSFLWL